MHLAAKVGSKQGFHTTSINCKDAAAAKALVLEEHPGGRAHAVDGALVNEENRVRMLGA